MIVGLLACFGADLCCCSSKLCGHLCLHIRAHMQQARARHPVPFSEASHFISLSQGLSLTLKLIVLGQLPSQRAPGSYLFPLPNAEVTGTGSPHLLCGYWRFELSCLHSCRESALIHGAISPATSPKFAPILPM